MWQYVISGIFMIIVALIEAQAAKDRKNRKEEIERQKRHEEERANELRLSMCLIHATLQLSVVSSNALTGGHNNGNVERARLAAKKAEEEYDNFLKELGAKQVAKT